MVKTVQPNGSKAKRVATRGTPPMVMVSRDRSPGTTGDVRAFFSASVSDILAVAITTFPSCVEGKDELAVAEQERPRVRLDSRLRRLDHVLPPAHVVLDEDPPLAFHVLGELVGLEVQERDDDARHGVPRQGGCGDPADHESGDEEREHDGYDLRSNFHMAPGPHTTTSGLFCHREKNW